MLNTLLNLICPTLPANGTVGKSGSIRRWEVLVSADSHPRRSFFRRGLLLACMSTESLSVESGSPSCPSAHTPMPIMGSSPGNILPNAIWSWNIENTARCFFVVMRIRLTQALFVFQEYWCSGIAHSLWAWPWLMTHDSRLQQEETCVFELCCADCNSCHAGWL